MGMTLKGSEWPFRFSSVAIRCIECDEVNFQLVNTRNDGWYCQECWGETIPPDGRKRGSYSVWRQSIETWRKEPSSSVPSQGNS